MQNDSQKQVVSAIIIAGVLIAGAILLRGSKTPTTDNPTNNGTSLTSITLSPIGPTDRTLGNPQAKVTFVLYEDFQCPFCGRFFSDSEKNIRDTYVKNGDMQFVYRDFAFLGEFVKPYVVEKDESINAAEAARCAGDQGKFWEYHEYLYTHQNEENKGNFSILNLKSFAKGLGLDTATFNQCLDTNKYAQAVADSKTEGTAAGVTGTPKGFLVTSKDISSSAKTAIIQAATTPGYPPAVTFYAQKNIVSLDGALPWSMVKAIIDILLK